MATLNAQAKIECQNINHVFQKGEEEGTTALQDVSLRVRDCEYLCLLGPSGCGKTTLLRIIAGLIEPTEGLVLLDGQPSMGPDADKGMVFQRDATFPWLTVEENVEYGLKLRGISKSDRRATVKKYVQLVGLSGFEKAFPKELSGGMRKRVDIARTYAYNPKVLLMDEPFGSLDLFTKTRMQAELLDLWSKERKTVVFVTHDLEEAIFLSDRVAVMSKRPGRIRKIIEIDLPRPRSVELKVSAAFDGIRRQLWEEFEEEFGVSQPAATTGPGRAQ